MLLILDFLNSFGSLTFTKLKLILEESFELNYILISFLLYEAEVLFDVLTRMFFSQLLFPLESTGLDLLSPDT